ncbi:uncharacterized protein LOC118198357 isoform X2 [Stegodyphus dumicola]|uniref:uncharacterized protein LOC118198357 isoform X2 n=1 Tax=Stegodyphus dumicola TaxID=202533 RepID=UPI0015ACB358|nr:uncharacterized protein LOC118198357 isoform X2 [Stegodyphus dumicola]
MHHSHETDLTEDYESLQICTAEDQDEIIGAIETSHNNSSKQKVSNICFFYEKNGYCKYGDNCTYVHNKKSSYRDNRIGKNANLRKQNNNSYVFRSSHITRKIPCRYFKTGNCGKAENCLYSHSGETDSSLISEVSLESSKQVKKHKDSSVHKSKKAPLCHYFKRGQCRNGDNCKFFHQKKYVSEKNSKTTCLEKSNEENKSKKEDKSVYDNSVPSLTEVTKEKPIEVSSLNVRKIYELTKLTEDDVINLRNTEITQLRKRFPSLKIIKENETFIISFQPSDPDWPFDLKNLEIQVDFPENYPKKVCQIKVLESADYIPPLLIRFLNRSIKDWLSKKFEDSIASDKVELVFRPFLRWFDRTLEDLFISGLRLVKLDIQAKDAGIEFVPPEKLFESSTATSNQENTSDISDQSDTEQNLNNSEVEEQSEKSLCKDIVSQPKKNEPINTAVNQGMKVLFSDLELTEGAAALTCTKISVMLQCSRCRTSCNAEFASNKSNSQKCSKCYREMVYAFNPATLHPFSNVLGTLQLTDCQIIDINLVECHFLVDCLNCSKQVAVDGIHYGQQHKMWCKFCNQKLLISIRSAKFQASKPTYTAIKYQPAKKIQKTKDPIVKEGEPLPQCGACKHYKKSFRWLRFPCCGRVYPCDVCHNEKETDHEMKFASRMICGFCAKEQPYSKDKPCFGCSADLTKKAGSHWEGGKGCRNKIQMSRMILQK